MAFFEYGAVELNHLKSACPKLGAVIDRVGILERKINPDPFSSLIYSVVGQQISVKAADTIFARLETCVGQMRADKILAKTEDDLQACGLSYRKVGYIRGICEAVASGELNFKQLEQLTDQEVIAELVKLKGIGEWSAEMFMIFTSQRMDILSYGDLIIRKAIMKLYGLEALSKKDFEYYRKLYSPYGSVASIYLWYLGTQ